MQRFFNIVLKVYGLIFQGAIGSGLVVWLVLLFLSLFNGCKFLFFVSVIVLVLVFSQYRFWSLYSVDHYLGLCLDLSHSLCTILVFVLIFVFSLLKCWILYSLGIILGLGLVLFLSQSWCWYWRWFGLSLVLDLVLVLFYKDFDLFF